MSNPLIATFAKESSPDLTYIFRFGLHLITINAFVTFINLNFQIYETRNKDYRSIRMNESLSETSNSYVSPQNMGKGYFMNKNHGLSGIRSKCITLLLLEYIVSL